MNLTEIKTICFLALMIVFLVMALIINDVIDSKLFASLGVITGALANKSLSKNSVAEE